MSLRGKAVKEARAADTHEILLGATRCAVGGVPGRAWRRERNAIWVPDSRAAFVITCPVAAGLVVARRKCRANNLCAGQHVVFGKLRVAAES